MEEENIICQILFVSWSKAKSREFALEIKYLIESLDPHSNVFMSEENISARRKSSRENN